MNKAAAALAEMQPERDFFVGVDSDGCVFDTMGIKQRECFCPMMIAYFNLQPVAEAARECKDFADLFSKTRGANRHKTMVRILRELLPGHPMVRARNFEVPKFEYYCEWVNDDKSLLSNDGLKKAIEQSSGACREELERALKWSLRVNDLVAEIVKGIPPFKYVRESLEKMRSAADVIVCSATPTEALEREWAEHGIDEYVRVIAGQEAGTKAEHLKIAAVGKYPLEKCLMIGDAPGDMRSAKANGMLFYPINPGNEQVSWERFYKESFDRFVSGEYAGAYEKGVINEYESYLPERPSWEKGQR